MRSSIVTYVLTLIGGIAIGAIGITALRTPGQTPTVVPDVAQNLKTPGITQTIIFNTPLAGFPGKKALMFIGDFEPGASTPKHLHPGTEFLFVLEGEGVIEQPGQSPVELNPGVGVFSEPGPDANGFIHQAKNLSQTNRMKTLVLLIYDKDGPPAVPVD